MSKWRSSIKNEHPQQITVELPQMDSDKSEKDPQISSPILSNKLYFYSDVTRDSIHILNRQIDELTRSLRVLQIQYDLIHTPVIELFISSDGGEIFAGLAAVDKIINNPISIHTKCEGIVASAATFLSVVGKKRTISENSTMLVHQISSSLWGNYAQFQDEIKNLDLIMKIVRKIYFKHTKFTESDLEEMLKHDLCLSSEDCLKFGLVDEIC